MTSREQPIGGRTAARTWWPATARVVAGGWRAHWPVAAVLAALAVAAVIVPTLVPVATTDDWGYSRSAQILIAEGRLVVFPVVAATAVFQIVWGALFGWLLEPTLGVFRLSTVVMVGLGAVGLYGLCRELGIDRHRAALGTAAYLFNPLLFVLAFTFMTDPHFVSLLVIATWWYARGLRPDALAPGWVIVGSGVAGLALLARQQGVLIPVAVVVFLLVTRRLRLDGASVRLFLQVVALPVVMFGGYLAWLTFGNDVPQVQTSFLQELVEEGWAGTWWLAQRLTVVELAYLGFFTLPLVVAALAAGISRSGLRKGRIKAADVATRLGPPTPQFWGAFQAEPSASAKTNRPINSVPSISRAGWLLLSVWSGILLVGTTGLWLQGMKMPYIGQFFGSGGLGPPDVLGSRPRLFSSDARTVLTVVCVLASLGLALIAARAIGAAPVSPERATAGLVLAVGIWQVVGIFPPSYHYIGWTAGSLDRYLLPIIPLAIALTLWALRDRRLLLPAGWLIVALLALFAVAGTRDYLVYLRSVWSVATDAVAAGAPLDQIDAGAAWDGYYLYEAGLVLNRGRTPRGGPWWVYFYGRATDSSYVVSSTPKRGYFQVWKRNYSSWLNREPATVYFLRRGDRSWPPTGRGSLLRELPDRPLAPELAGSTRE